LLIWCNRFNTRVMYNELILCRYRKLTTLSVFFCQESGCCKDNNKRHSVRLFRPVSAGFLIQKLFVFPHFHPLKCKIYKHIYHKGKNETAEGHKKMTFAEVHCSNNCGYQQAAEKHGLPVSEIIIYKF